MGFFEVRWGGPRDGEAQKQDQASSRAKLDEAMKVIQDAYADAMNPAHSAADKSAKMTWVGGAARILSVVSGRSGEDVMNEVKAARPVVSALAPKPPAADPVFKLTRPEDRQNRPPRPPGAQRPLTPEEMAQPPVEADQGASITASPLRTSTN